MELDELKNICKKMFEIKTKLSELEETKKSLTLELNDYKRQVMIELEKNDMKNFKSGGMQLIKVDKKSVKIEDREAFLDWLESRGVLRDALNVTAATATQIYKEEYERAQDDGNMVFIMEGIPGLSDPETFSTISMRGK